MNIFKYDLILGDWDSKEEKEERRLRELEAQRVRKLNDILGIKDEGETIIGNRDKIVTDILDNIEENKSILTRIKNWF